MSKTVFNDLKTVREKLVKRGRDLAKTKLCLSRAGTGTETRYRIDIEGELDDRDEGIVTELLGNPPF